MRLHEPLNKRWLPRMDSNHDKQIQNLQCYRYTTRQYFVIYLKHLREAPTRLPQKIGVLPVCNGEECAHERLHEQGESFRA